MAKLIYAAMASLDGYVNDETGNFAWAAPDAEVHAFVNDLERRVGTQLLGRRMYEVLRYWETPDDDIPPVEQAYAEMWQAADKVVYSTTLETVTTARTRIERTFDADAVRQMKTSAGSDLSVGGPGLAARAMEAGVVDECHLFLNPLIVGGGTRAFPDGGRVDLELLDQRRFAGGVVYLRYRVTS